MPTRDDIARMARVSSATVSRAYNRPEEVSPEKRARIWKTAEKLGYVPDKNASALRRSGSGAIALLEQKKPGLSSDRYYSWLYAEIVRSVKTVIDASPYRLLLLTADTPQDILEFSERAVCDAFLCHGLDDPGMMDAVRKTGLPLVSCWREYNPKISAVQLDEIKGGRKVGVRFAQAGLCRPAHITGHLRALRVCQERLEGFKSAFSGTEIKVMDQELGIRGGYLSTQKLLPDIRTGRIDCLFVVNDLTAIGAVQALSEAGLRIPRDISVIGYGNLPFIDTLPVKLTTVDEQMGAIYARAAQLVLELMKENRLVREMVAPGFIEGDSVKRRRI
jgi:DNA-binding LacI/PurR family transcriptional regulator